MVLPAQQSRLGTSQMRVAPVQLDGHCVLGTVSTPGSLQDQRGCQPKAEAREVFSIWQWGDLQPPGATGVGCTGSISWDCRPGEGERDNYLQSSRVSGCRVAWENETQRQRKGNDNQGGTWSPPCPPVHRSYLSAVVLRHSLPPPGLSQPSRGANLELRAGHVAWPRSLPCYLPLSSCSAFPPPLQSCLDATFLPCTSAPATCAARQRKAEPRPRCQPHLGSGRAGVVPCQPSAPQSRLRGEGEAMSG